MQKFSLSLTASALLLTAFVAAQNLTASAFRKHSGQMNKVFSELSPEELRGLEVALKKLGTRAAALTAASLA